VRTRLTARAKGLPTRRIVWRHAVRNALLPLVTLIALELGFSWAGAAGRGDLQLARIGWPCQRDRPADYPCCRAGS